MGVEGGHEMHLGGAGVGKQVSTPEARRVWTRDVAPFRGGFRGVGGCPEAGHVLGYLFSVG